MFDLVVKQLKIQMSSSCIRDVASILQRTTSLYKGRGYVSPRYKPIQRVPPIRYRRRPKDSIDCVWTSPRDYSIIGKRY